MAAPPASNLLLAQTLSGLDQLPLGLQAARSGSPILLGQAANAVHAAQVAAANQAKLVSAGAAAQQAGLGKAAMQGGMPGQATNLAQLQALQAQRLAQQGQAAPQLPHNLANNPAALLLMQSQMAQAQGNGGMSSSNYPVGLQNNPIAAAAAAAAAVAASQQQARMGNPAATAGLLQAAAAAGLQRPNGINWAQAQAQVLQSAAAAQQAQAQAQTMAVALQQAQRANQIQAAQAAAAAGRSGVNNAAQLQVLRQLQARLAAQGNHAGNQGGQLGGQMAGLNALTAAAAGQKPNDAQLQALRAALARTAAGRAALSAAATQVQVNAQAQANLINQAAGRGTPGLGGAGGMNIANGVHPLQQALNLQAALQQRNAQVAANAQANVFAGLQSNAATFNMAALQHAAQRNAASPTLPGGSEMAKYQLAKAMEMASMPQRDTVSSNMPAAGQAGGAQGVSAASNKEQRRLALACVALQLARGGMTVEQAINSGIMGGMSVTDVKFIVECYNAERQRMNDESPGNNGQQQQQHQQGGQQPSGQHQQHMDPSMGLPAAKEDMLYSTYAAFQQQSASGNMSGMGQHMAGPQPGPHSHSSGSPPPYVGSPTHLPMGSPTGEALVHAKQMHQLGMGSYANDDKGMQQRAPGRSSPPGSASPEPVGSPGQRASPSDFGGNPERPAPAGNGKPPFDAFSYGFFDVPASEGGSLLEALEDGGLGALSALGELGGALEGDAAGDRSFPDLTPDSMAWLEATANANAALWNGDSAGEDVPNNDDMVERLANLDLGSGFF